ncbi:MAG: mismatch repair protein MutH [Polyangiaceae bacterium]|jgi:DNA mismatch repair protein MutH|nr:mismatch repair protein MutH [Polyangiaceae bacterium]
MIVLPPRDEAELLARAAELAGLRLAELAGRFAVAVPPDLRRAKGFVGGLLERALGATAGSRAVPDFPDLHIELKTLPVDRGGSPVESTFVCTIPLAEIGEVEWAESRVRRKLSRVLWVPVEGERTIVVAERRIGQALLYELTAEDEALLRADWEELSGYIGRGHVEELRGHFGKVLQIRPKAAHSRARRLGFDAEGAPFAALPRGFYLRPSFTGSLLARHFALPR